jgi:tape measure domain-containing protein
VSIQEKIDLVGNVKAQARAWAREIDKLTAKMRALNGLSTGKGGGQGPVTVARSEERRARAMRDQARSQTQMTRQARAQARVAPQYGPGRKEAAASAVVRHRDQQRAAAAVARTQTAAMKAQARAEAQSQKTGGKSNTNGRRGLGPALPRQEVGGIGGAMNSAAGNLGADLAGAATGMLIDTMKSLAGTFVEAQKFRENSIAGLTILQKSGSEAKKTWDESFKLARQTGSTQQETMSSIQGMMSSGFKKGDAVELFKLMSAVSAINPKANLDGIVTAISQIKNTGKLQGDELLQLADAGVSVDQVYKALGKRLGKTREQIIAMQGAGEIKADDAIAAIKDAMAESVGGKDKVDGVLKGKANSLSAIMTQLQAAPMTFFSGLEQDPALMEKMKGSLKGLVDLLDPGTEKGKKFAESFAKMIDAIAGPGADAFAKLADAAPGMATAMTSLITAFSGPGGKMLVMFAEQMVNAAKGLEMVAAAAMNADAMIRNFFGSLDIGLIDAIFAAVMAFNPLSLVSTLIGKLITAISGAAPAVGSAISSAFASLPSALSSIGSSAVQGLINGLLAGIPGLTAASSMIAGITPSIIAGAHKTASPSKLFTEQGMWDMAGLAKGYRDNIGLVQRESEKVADVGLPSSMERALPFVGDAMAERGMGRQTTNNFGGMRFNAGGFTIAGPGQAQPQDIAQDINRMIQQGIQSFMNKAAATT